jgi:malate dehydrogenase (oxaloacetate-decarboxylating)(NADP+)
VLVFPYLDPANASYQVLKVLGGASAVGPILLGLGKPVAALQQEATVDDIVNMTAYIVLKAQQQNERQALRA